MISLKVKNAGIATCWVYQASLHTILNVEIMVKLRGGKICMLRKWFQYQNSHLSGISTQWEIHIQLLIFFCHEDIEVSCRAARRGIGYQTCSWLFGFMLFISSDGVVHHSTHWRAWTKYESLLHRDGGIWLRDLDRLPEVLAKPRLISNGCKHSVKLLTQLLCDLTRSSPRILACILLVQLQVASQLARAHPV